MKLFERKICDLPQFYYRGPQPTSYTYYNIRARGCIGGGHLQTDRDPTGDSFEQKKMSRGCNKDRKDALYKYKDY